MALAFQQIQSIDVTLGGSGVNSTDTSIDVIGLTLPNGTAITTAMLGTAAIGYGTLEPETTREENISFTGITDNGNNSYTLTGVTRGLGFKWPYTADTALRQPHSGSTILRLSNSAPFYTEFSILRNDEAVTGLKTFATGSRPQLSVDADATDDDQLITHGELTRAVLGGVTVPKLTITAVAGETVAAGNLLYFKESDQRWWKVDADTFATASQVKIGFAQGAGTAGVGITGGVLIEGVDENQTGLTLGAKYYVSGTAGGITTTPGAISQFVGWANSATSIIISPDDAIDNIVTGTSGEALTVGQWVYFKASDARWWKVDTSSDASSRAVQIGVVQSAAGSAALPVLVRISGVDQTQTGLTAGTLYYSSTTTPGAIRAFSGGSSDTTRGPVGQAVSATRIKMFDKSDIYNATQEGIQTFALDTSGTDAYAITLVPAPPELTRGMTVRFRITVANTGAATLNVNGLGALPIVKGLSTALETGDLVADQIVTVVYNTLPTPEWQIVETPVNLLTGITTPIVTQHAHKRTKILAQRVANAASGAVTYAHGLAAIPNWVRISFTATAVNSFGVGNGAYDRVAATQGNSSVSYIAGTIAGNSDTTNTIAYVDGGGSQKGVVSVDGTNVTITWTLAGAPTIGGANLEMLIEQGV